jgi:glycosyltransferase involved in cell wall biosynthesis
MGVSLVYVNTLMFPQALTGAFLNRMKVIVHVHEVESKYPWLYYQFLMLLTVLLAERIICVCDYILRQRRIPLRRRLLRKARVVYNASSFDRAPIERAPDGAVQIITVAGISRLKGIPDLVPFVRALKQRAGERPFVLKVIGRIDDPALHKHIERETARHGTSDLLIFCGEQADVEPFYRNAHILLHPARSDVFPLVLLEAASFSLPVITTDAGGCPEAVADGRTGFVVAVGDTEAMAERAFGLMSDRELYKTLSQASYQRYQAEFTPAIMISQLRRALDGLV